MMICPECDVAECTCRRPRPVKRKQISQAEARRLRKRVQELEARERKRLSAWGDDYTPGSVHVATFDPADWVKGRLWMAKQLGCVFVGKYTSDEKFKVYAVPREATR